MATTVVTFEAGTIGDSIKKAASIAPGKVGSAFDKAAGVIMQITPGTESPCIVRATDTETFYTESVDVVNSEGDPCLWRLPSSLLASVLANQAQPGRNITFTQETPSTILISSGRMRARMVMMDAFHYPEWTISDIKELKVAPNFGANLTRVEWAAAKNGPAPLNGILLDGTHAIATDRFRIAKTPCAIDLEEPVIIPAGTIGRLLRPMGDVLIGTDEMLFVAMPDDYTQIRVITLGEKFPPIERITERPFEQEVKLHRPEFLDKIQKAEAFAGANRSPIVTLYFGKSEVAISLENPEVGLFGDVMETPGSCDHDRIKIKMSPSMLIGSLTNAPGNGIVFKYNPSNTNAPVAVFGESGYETWLAPITEKTPTE